MIEAPSSLNHEIHQGTHTLVFSHSRYLDFMIPNMRVRDEAMKGAQKLASPATPMVTANKNSGHLINLNEFKELVREHLCGQYSDARLRSWFLRLDTNGSGTVRPAHTLTACSIHARSHSLVAPLPSQ